MNGRLLRKPLATLIITLSTVNIWAHCQIPCGIYGDDIRFALMREDIETIEKSMRQIKHIGEEEKPDYNQLVRWVINKEEHAGKLTETVTAYFMAQRVKPASPTDKDAYAKYVEQLTILHRIMVSAMKAKQTTDLGECAKLRRLVDQFEKTYKH